MTGGTVDERSAFRWTPVAPEQLQLSVVAFWDRRVSRVRFVVLYGMAFGFGAAVLNYNRKPELLTAAARCLANCVCTHQYDDHLTADTTLGEGSAQQAYNQLCDLTKGSNSIPTSTVT